MFLHVFQLLRGWITFHMQNKLGNQPWQWSSCLFLAHSINSMRDPKPTPPVVKWFNNDKWDPTRKLYISPYPSSCLLLKSELESWICSTILIMKSNLFRQLWPFIKITPFLSSLKKKEGNWNWSDRHQLEDRKNEGRFNYICKDKNNNFWVLNFQCFLLCLL